MRALAFLATAAWVLAFARRASAAPQVAMDPQGGATEYSPKKLTWEEREVTLVMTGNTPTEQLWWAVGPGGPWRAYTGPVELAHYGAATLRTRVGASADTFADGAEQVAHYWVQHEIPETWGLGATHLKQCNVGVVPYRTRDLGLFGGDLEDRAGRAARLGEARDPRSGGMESRLTMGNDAFTKGRVSPLRLDVPGWVVIPLSPDVDGEAVKGVGVWERAEAPEGYTPEDMTDLSSLRWLEQHGGSLAGCTMDGSGAALFMTLVSAHDVPSVSPLTTVMSHLMTRHGRRAGDAAACVGSAFGLTDGWTLGYAALWRDGRDAEARGQQLAELQVMGAVAVGAAHLEATRRAGPRRPGTRPARRTTDALVAALADTLHDNECRGAGLDSAEALAAVWAAAVRELGATNFEVDAALTGDVARSAALAARELGTRGEGEGRAAVAAAAARGLALLAGKLAGAAGRAWAGSGQEAFRQEAVDLLDSDGGMAAAVAQLESEWGVLRTRLQVTPAPTLPPGWKPEGALEEGEAGGRLSEEDPGMWSEGRVIGLTVGLVGAVALVSGGIYCFRGRTQPQSESSLREESIRGKYRWISTMMGKNRRNANLRPKGIEGEERMPYVFASVEETVGMMAAGGLASDAREDADLEDPRASRGSFTDLARSRSGNGRHRNNRVVDSTGLKEL